MDVSIKTSPEEVIISIEGSTWDGLIPNSKPPKHLIFFNLLPLFVWWKKDFSSHPFLICMTAALQDAKSFLSLALPSVSSLLFRPEQISVDPTLGGVLKRLHLFMRLDLAFQQWLARGGKDHPGDHKNFIISESFQLNISSSSLALSLINQANKNKKDLQQLYTRKPVQNFGRKFGRGGKGMLSGRNPNNNHKQIVCWSCGGKGHTKNKCLKNKNPSNSKPHPK